MHKNRRQQFEDIAEYMSIVITLLQLRGEVSEQELHAELDKFIQRTKERKTLELETDIQRIHDAIAVMIDTIKQ